MEALRKRLVGIVADEWPLTLEAWDIWQENLIETWPRHGTSSLTFNEWAPEPASAVMFAHEFGCAQILPAAVYLLSTVSDLRPWDTPGMEQVRKHRARWHLVDAQVWRTLYRGRVALDEYYVYRIGWVPALWDARGQHTTRCQKPESKACELTWKRILTSIFEPRWWSTAAHDPLHEMMKRAEDDESSIVKDMCASCWCTLQWRIHREREALWCELPSKFGLDGPEG